LSSNRVLFGEMVQEDWQRAVITELRARIGSFPEALPPLDIRATGTIDMPGIYMRRLCYTSEEGLCTPAYYLLPEGSSGPHPAVVAIAGHGYGHRDIVGLLPDGMPRGDADPGYAKDFALALCRRGFAVIVPEMLGFGDLRLLEDVENGPAANSCHRITTCLSMLGRTMAGVRVLQTIRAVDALAALGDADISRVGIMGISGGGLVASFSAVLEPRFRACVVSGYANLFRDSVLAMRHCVDNFAMGLSRDVELPDLLAAIAPRPMLWESGIHDPIFPYTAAQQAYEQVKGIYGMLGSPENLQLDGFDGGHQISGVVAYDFLWNALMCRIETGF